MDSKSITLIVCYFGEFPKWFDFFLETCKYNSSVKFLIFTDTNEPYPPMHNVTFEKLSLDEFSRLASQKLNLDIRISEAYKVCDYKPAYGVIFEDYLIGIDFWGHCDLDIVFGDIRSFITDKMLEEYDVITAKKEFLTGHFTLYNSRTAHRIYEHSKDYQYVFQCQELFSFDECNFLWWYLLNGHNILNMQSPVESMSHVVRKLNEEGAIKAYFDALMIEQDMIDVYSRVNSFKKKIVWCKGKLTDTTNNKNFLYFHFHSLKRLKNFRIPYWRNNSIEFMISNKGFTILQ